MRSVSIRDDLQPGRLDLFVAGHVPGCSRQAAQRAIAAGQVRVNGRRAQKGQTVRSGDVVEVAEVVFAPPVFGGNTALDIPVLYEDEVLVAVNKPAGLPSHALRAEETMTLANFLLARCPETAAVGGSRLESGLLHRLDTDTSGVLLAARTGTAYAALRSQFRTHRVLKEYVAVVDGRIRERGEIRTCIAHHRNPRMMQVEAPGGRAGRPAATEYAPLVCATQHTLLRVRIRTGVRHQIRVHLASIGHPITGDVLYGAAAPAGSATRHLLHARAIEFEHPETGGMQRIECDAPEDFAVFAAGLGERARRALGGARR
jgi:23S rRNA pseudouridine1911/1915/1917 synthase